MLVDKKILTVNKIMYMAPEVYLYYFMALDTKKVTYPFIKIMVFKKIRRIIDITQLYRIKLYMIK